MAPKGEIFICSPKRTAIGSLAGAFSTTPASELGAQVIKSVIGELKIPTDSVQGVIMGSVLTAGQGQAPARQAAIKSGLPNTVQALTVNKVCSSGLKAVMLAANEIELGQAQAVIAGGMENMTLAPYILPSLRSGAKLGHVPALDSIVHDGLWDVYNNFHMGNAAELCAREFHISREAQDAFAIESYARANNAIKQGYFEKEIVAVKVKAGRDEVEVKVDEEPGRGRPDKIPSLKPVFDKNGTVTAANASSINDGAAAMLVCSEDYLKQHKLKPIARIVAQAWNAQAPEWFTTAPVGAVQNVLKKAGLNISDIDLFEINEAFAAVALACQSGLEIPADKLNVSGGAVALGHPIGASGARILTTLTYALQRLNGKFGICSICNGGGEATALLVERLS